VLPRVAARVDDLARAIDIARLEARRRVGHELAAIDAVLVERARAGIALDELVPALALSAHRLPLAGDHQIDAARGRCPEAKAHAALRQDRGAERHGVAANQLSVPGNVDLTPFSGASCAATSDRGTRRPIRGRRDRRRARARTPRPRAG